VFQTERRARIVDLVRAHGRLSVNEAAEKFDTTKETIRRDLAELYREGLVRRVHGGAVAASPPPYDRLLERRGRLHVDEKHRIASAAVAQLPDRGVVIIDSGSTPRLVASMLPDTSALTVVTNSVAAVVVCASKPSLDVVVVGGDFKPDTMELVGGDSVRGFSRVCADVAIVGTDGYSERGLTCHSRDGTAAKRAMIGAARRTIAVADSSKFGNDYPMVFADLSDLDLLVTDTGLPEEAAMRIIKAGRELEVRRV
jgi:DeoR family fructose operon transcriptional repressor